MSQIHTGYICVCFQSPHAPHLIYRGHLNGLYVTHIDGVRKAQKTGMIYAVIYIFVYACCSTLIYIATSITLSIHGNTA